MRKTPWVECETAVPNAAAAAHIKPYQRGGGEDRTANDSAKPEAAGERAQVWDALYA
jgi:hypothetical protein